MDQKLCKNKKCQKPLPEGYKYKYCESCRAKQANGVKTAGKKLLAVVGVVGTTALTVLTARKIKPKS